MIDNRTVGRTIASLRQAKGMTQQQLAAAMNVSHQAVSKWENGAALPDIQTLIGLTQLFGITVEQLLSGEIPEARLEEEVTPGTEDCVKNIGNFVNHVIDDIGSVFRGNKKDFDTQTLEKTQNENTETANVDLKELLEMAPFMSKAAVAEMLEKCGRKLTASEIAKFAPFVDAVCLEKLIRESEDEFGWDSLRRLAPFLKKEAVDAFARAIALGEKLVNPVSGDVGRAADEAWKAVEDVSRRIEKGVDRAVRKVVRMGENMVNEVSKAFDDLSSETTSREMRRAQLRRSAIERALEEGRWDWIAAHLNDVQDEELRSRISEKAHREGMHDWVYEHLGGYADPATIDRAIAEGEWEWLGIHAESFDPIAQRTIAVAAMKAGQWEWLAARAEQLDLGPKAAEIASEARKNGAKMLAVQLMRYGLEDAEIEMLVQEAMDADDMEFIGMIADLLSADRMVACCEKLIREERWDDIERLSGWLDIQGLEQLMEFAIEIGNFDAVDRIDEMIGKAEEE